MNAKYIIYFMMNSVSCCACSWRQILDYENIASFESNISPNRYIALYVQALKFFSFFQEKGEDHHLQQGKKYGENEADSAKVHWR